jgi:DNA-binding helix-turn-helix protein
MNTMKNIEKLRKFLLNLRNENDRESILGMSERLGISESYLSRIERGERSIPKNFVDDVAKTYKLDNTQKKELSEIVNSLTNEIKLSLENIPKDKKEMAIKFAKNFKKLGNKEVSDISEILGRGN